MHFRGSMHLFCSSTSVVELLPLLEEPVFVLSFYFIHDHVEPLPLIEGSCILSRLWRVIAYVLRGRDHFHVWLAFVMLLMSSDFE